MNPLLAFLKDIRFLVPVSVFILFEVLMQLGIYRPLLRPKTYAENVNRIVETVTESPVQPDVLILGTSVAYQGVNLPELNELLKEHHVVVQSGATEGAKLITQHMLFRTLQPKLPGLKLVLHFVETSYPYTARNGLDGANRSMVAQFDRFDTFDIMNKYQYRLTINDYNYFLVRSITYQQDLRDFALDPLYRLKQLSRKFSAPKEEYSYVNTYTYKISSYSDVSLEDCKANALKGIPEQDENGTEITDKHHRKAAYQTCELGHYDPSTHPGQDQWSDLFFQRLALFYHDIRSRNLKVILVFPPYSNLIHDLNAGEKMKRFKEKLAESQPGESFPILDLRNVLDGPHNGDYYYDTIHLNGPGSRKFTKFVAEELIRHRDYYMR